MPVTSCAAAATATVGAVFTTFKLTAPCTPLTIAVINGVAPVPGAVNTPSELIDPTELDQVTPGCGEQASPNWSFTTADAVVCPFNGSVDVSVLTATLVAVWVTVTGVELVSDINPSVIVLVRTYVPALLNVTTVSFAAFVAF